MVFIKKQLEDVLSLTRMHRQAGLSSLVYPIHTDPVHIVIISIDNESMLKTVCNLFKTKITEDMDRYIQAYCSAPLPAKSFTRVKE